MQPKLTQRLWAKILAVFLLLFGMLAAAAGAFGIYFCYEQGIYREIPNFYSSEMCQSASFSLACEIRDTLEAVGLDQAQAVLDQSYSARSTNAQIQIYRQNGLLLAENEASAQISTDSVISMESPIYTSLSAQSWQQDTDSSWQGESFEQITIQIAVSTTLQAHDIYAVRLQQFSLLLHVRYWLLLPAIGGFLLFLASLIFLFCAVGHRAGSEQLHLTWLDRIPFDLLSIAVLFFFSFADNFSSYELSSFVFLAALFALLLVYLLSFAARCKTGTLLKNTLILRLFRFLRRFFARSYRALPLYGKALLLFLAIALAELILIVPTVQHSGFALILFVLLNAVLLAAACFGVYQLQMLKRAGSALAEGNFDYKVDTHRMYWEFRTHAEHLNSIGDGMAIALEQRMRSERLKTELITNVSHDIKTPLTSMINYTNLLQRPELTPAQREEYLQILLRQSQRLKKLTEDLVEASKASTGNLPVYLVPTNLEELLQQAVAEYADRLSGANLQPILTVSEPALTAQADGRLLWRVIDNLLSNVCKYALSGTRVYLEAKKTETEVVLAVKNISRQPLNLSPDELMERFVRGDSARSSEGSGLGLSIAQSLTTLQHGTFSLAIDGDLFKAEIHLGL